MLLCLLYITTSLTYVFGSTLYTNIVFVVLRESYDAEDLENTLRSLSDTCMLYKPVSQSDFNKNDDQSNCLKLKVIDQPSLTDSQTVRAMLACHIAVDHTVTTGFKKAKKVVKQ